MAGIDEIGSRKVPVADSAQNELMTQVIGNKADTALQAATAADSMMRYIKGLLLGQADIFLDTQIRVIQSGAQAIVGAATEWLRIDSDTNGAEIISIAIAGINQHAWTLDVYVPTADAVAAPAADDKRDTIAYLVGDTEGGLLKPFGIPFNCYLQFTNDGGDDQIDQVTVTYRSRGVLTLTWGP